MNKNQCKICKTCRLTVLIVSILAAAIASWTYANGSYDKITDTSHSKTTKSSLQPYTASYSIKKHGATIALLSYQVKAQDSGWHITTHAKPKGLAALLTNQTADEESQLAVKQNQLLPLTYARTHSKEGEKRNIKINYDWTKKQADYAEGTENHTLTLQEPTYDSLSLQLAMMQDLSTGPDSLQYHVIDDGKIEVQKYDRVAEEQLRINGKSMQTISLQRQYGNKETRMWFAPELNYLLVKMQKYRKGKLKSDLLLNQTDIAQP